MAESVTGVLDAFYSALSNADAGWLEGRLAPAPAVHITTTAEGWLGPEEFLAGLRRQFAEVSLEWTRGHAVLEERGEMAWVADCPTIRFDDGSKLFARLTLVFVRDGGAWKLAHSHLDTTE